MGPNMSSPERRPELPDQPIKDPPTNEQHNPQSPSNSSSAEFVNPEESTRLFNRLVDTCDTPTPSTYSDPFQVNLLVRLLENGVPSVELTDLFFAGTLPLNALIDKPKKNGDLVVSFILPQDIPGPKEKLIDWTRAILLDKFPLGITSILSPKQAKDTLDLIQLIHTHSTRKEEPLEKKLSSWEPDPSRIHCVVYKIQYQNHQIAVLRVDEAAEEHKQHFDSNRINFAKAIIIPLVLSLRIFTFKSVQTDLEAMENRNNAWWLPIVAERARRAREQNASLSSGYRTLRAPIDGHRVFGSTSQSWLGGYEATTFELSAYQPRRREFSNIPSSVADTTADISSTSHNQKNQKNTESTGASRRAAKKKAKKAAQKEAKKAENESSRLRERNQTESIEPAVEYNSPDQDNVNKSPTRDRGGESAVNYDSSKFSTERISPNYLTSVATADKSQHHTSTVATQQINEHPSFRQGKISKVLADDNNAKLEATGVSSNQPAKAPVDKVVSTGSSTVEATAIRGPEENLPGPNPNVASGTSGSKPASLPAPKTLRQVFSSQDSSASTTPLKTSIDITTKSAGEQLSESSASIDTSVLAKQKSVSTTTHSMKDDPPKFPTPNPSHEITGDPVEKKPAQPAFRKKNKRNKKGSAKPKNEGQMQAESTQQAKSTMAVSGSAAGDLTADTMPGVSTFPSEPSQTKQPLPHSPIGSSSTPSSKSSIAEQTSTENILSLSKTSRVDQKSTSVGDQNVPSSASSTKSVGNKKSTSTSDATETLSTCYDKPSKDKQTHAPVDKPAKTPSSSLKESSQPKETSTVDSSSYIDSKQEPSSELNRGKPDVKSTDSKPNLPTKKESANSGPFAKGLVSGDNTASAENEHKVVSPSEESLLSSKQTGQELPPKGRAEGELKGERPAEKEENENKTPEPKKKSKRARKARNKKGASSIPDGKSGKEIELTTSDISINSKPEASTSNAPSYNESGSTKSNATFDGKTSVAPPRLTTNDSINSSKSKDIQSSKVTTSAGASNKQAHISPGKSDHHANARSAGMGNQTFVKAPTTTESARNTKVSGTIGTRNIHPLAENITSETPVAGPAPETRSTRTSTNISSANPPTQGRQANQGFFWQLDSHGFPCAMAGCEKRCSSWDGASVICPKCGPYSEIRYCGKEHLFEDVKYHWLQCGTRTFRHPCRASTIPREQKEGPPLLPSLHNWDTPERFRLAVRHAADKSGDYFVFRDWQDWLAAGRPANTVAVRCSTKVIHTVRFDDLEEKDRFRRLLGIALFNFLQSFELVGYLFRLIRGNALAKGQWSEELDLALRYQFNLEYGFAVGPWLGTRHACETEWTGANHRHCSDAVCRAERVQLLGDRGVGRGFEHLCEYMEASHWLLRAARRTHPSVAAVEERMRGEGFEGVVPDDQRVFRRGEGWDGVGTGDMEIEGVNLF